MTVLEIRLPTTGISPQMNVTKTMVVRNGTCWPNIGRMSSR